MIFTFVIIIVKTHLSWFSNLASIGPLVYSVDVYNNLPSLDLYFSTNGPDLQCKRSTISESLVYSVDFSAITFVIIIVKTHLSWFSNLPSIGPLVYSVDIYNNLPSLDH